MSTYIIGNIRKIIYENDVNSYKVGIFKVRETNSEDLKIYVNHTIYFIGNFNTLSTELNYKFEGNLINHPKYGLQFSVSRYELMNPTNNEEIISYLAGGYFEGIGLKLAKKIVDKFGDKTLEVIKSNPIEIASISGITRERAEAMSRKINTLSEEESLIIDLTKFGFSVKESINIVKNYKLNISDIMKSNLYILTNIIDFEKIDSIYLKYNDYKTDLRIENIILYCIKNICYKTGNTMASEEALYLEFIKYFKNEFSVSDLKLHLKNLINQYKIYKFGEYLMLNYFYESEKLISNRIKMYNSIKENNSVKSIDKYIKTFEKQNKIVLNEDQKKAIEGSINNNLFIISGGPGTGKTTIVKAIANFYEDKNGISLLAPTGRSAKRLSESVLLPAFTIHKFLKWNKEDGTFGLNENNKSSAKIVIVDEFSMVDIFLFSSLLLALKDTVKLILVGDANQLPSINPGNLLYDLLNSENINKKYLTVIYRTGTDSYINTLAENIKNKMIFNEIKDYSDFKFISSEDINIIKYLTIICKKIKNKGISLDEFQVLVPMYNGINGIDNLNRVMQDIFNPYDDMKREIVSSDVTYREGDKIIQLVNDIDNNIYNGDIGYIKLINLYPKKSIEIDFSGNIVVYESDSFDKISLSYAISIHKSQGSEYDNVVVILASSHKRMFYNKLIYTGCTRAKKSLVIIGQRENFNFSISSTNSSKRITHLNNLL